MTPCDDGGYDFRTIAEAMTRAEPAERFVAGCLFRSAAAADRARELLRADRFTYPQYRLVFEVAAAMRAAGEQVDAGLFLARAADAGMLGDFGPDPKGFLIDLVDECRHATPANLDAAAGLVDRHAALRDLYHLATELARDALSPTDAPDVLAERYARRLAAVADGRPGARDPEPMAAAAVRAQARYDALGDEGPADGIPTGLGGLDGFTGGLRPGRLYVAAARPGGGKSALLLHLLLAAARAGRPAVLFTLEMGADENFDRAVSATAGVPGSVLQGRRKLSADDAGRVARHLGPGGLAHLPVYLDDDPAHSAATLAAAARRAVRRRGVKLVAVDYLQLLRPDDPRAPRYQAVGEATKALKRLARELGVAVVAAAQMNRAVDARADKEPQLSDLRDSGEIEQHADCVMFLHRLTDDPRRRDQDVDLLIKKQRNGPLGRVGLVFDQPLVRFRGRDPDA